MFDKFCLKDVLVKYKQDFVSTQWGNEKYKWEAVKCFQDNWDVNAADFADMLTQSLAKTYNLLASMNNFPARMITGFAKTAPEEDTKNGFSSADKVLAVRMLPSFAVYSSLHTFTLGLTLVQAGFVQRINTV